MEIQRLECDERFYARLRQRTAAAGAVIFLIPFLLFYVVMRFATDHYVRRQTFTRLEAGVASNAQLLEDVFALRVAEAQSLARALGPQPLNAQRSAGAACARVLNGNPWFGLALIADASGEVRAGTEGVTGNVAEQEFFRRALKGETALAGPVTLPGRAQREIVIATPLPAWPGVQPEIFLVTVRSEKLAGRLLTLGVGETENSFLVTPGGEFVTPPRRERRFVAGNAFAEADRRGVPLWGSAGASTHRDYRDVRVLAAYQQLTRGYYIVAQVDEAEVLSQVEQLRGEILLYVLPFLLLGFVLAALAWRYALNYIQRLMTGLYEALQLAEQREHERDLAHQQLARRFEEERELARQKAQFQAQLAEYEKYAALAQLALGAAHEINNPLLGILSHLELELRAARDASTHEEIEQCIQGAKRIAATLRGLLNYARPGPLTLSQVHLARMVDDTLAFLHHQPLFRGITIENNVPANLPAITADATQFSQVLMNLLLNAAQAMPQGGRISISADCVPGTERIEICVRDDGTGIPPEVLPHIFEPFFTTKRGRGTGLGLSITHAYIRSHGGEIDVESPVYPEASPMGAADGPRGGTLVRIRMPIRQEASAMGGLETLEVVG
jgi:signal transduction histidine kinase